MMVKSALLLCIVALICLYSSGASAGRGKSLKCAAVSCLKPPGCENEDQFTPPGQCCPKCRGSGEASAVLSTIVRPRINCAAVSCLRPPICKNRNLFTPPGQCCPTCCAAVRCPIFCPFPFRRNRKITKCCPKCKSYFCRFVPCPLYKIVCKPGQRVITIRVGCCRRPICIRRLLFKPLLKSRPKQSPGPG